MACSLISSKTNKPQNTNKELHFLQQQGSFSRTIFFIQIVFSMFLIKLLQLKLR